MTELHYAGRLTATTDTSAAAARSEAIVIIVPAHLTPEREIDFHVLQAASRAVGQGLQRGALVVYETTVSINSHPVLVTPCIGVRPVVGQDQAAFLTGVRALRSSNWVGLR